LVIEKFEAVRFQAGDHSPPDGELASALATAVAPKSRLVVASQGNAVRRPRVQTGEF